MGVPLLRIYRALCENKTDKRVESVSFTLAAKDEAQALQRAKRRGREALGEVTSIRVVEIKAGDQEPEDKQAKLPGVTD